MSPFSDDVNRLARDRLKARTDQYRMFGWNVEKLHRSEFDFYECWCHHLGLEPHIVSTTTKTDHERLDELKRWYVIHAAMSNFRGLANVRCFLFHWWDGATDQWLEDQMTALYEVMRISSNLRKDSKGALGDFLNYDDLNQLFSSRPFVEHWMTDGLRDHIFASLCDRRTAVEWKSYREKSDRYLFGLMSWLHFYRNWYFLVFSHIIFISGVFLATGRYWLIKVCLGGALLTVSLALKLSLDWWLDPLPWRVRWAHFRRQVTRSAVLPCCRCAGNLDISTRCPHDPENPQHQTKDNSNPHDPTNQPSSTLWHPSHYVAHALRPEVFRSHQRQRCGAFLSREWCFSFLFTVIVATVKFASEWLLVYLAEGFSSQLLQFGVLHLVLLWIFLHLGFLLDTVFFYNLVMAISSYIHGRIRGVGRVRDWKTLRERFPELAERFARKAVCPATDYRRDDKLAALMWALFWNHTLILGNADDLLSQAEFDRLTFSFSYAPSALSPSSSSSATSHRHAHHSSQSVRQSEQNSVAQSPTQAQCLPKRWVDETFLKNPSLLADELVVHAHPDLSRAPRNTQMTERLLHLANSLLMPRLPLALGDLTQLSSSSVVIPVYNETVIYSLEEICRPVNAGRSVMGYMISKFPDEWDNFVERNQVERSHRLQEVTTYLTSGHVVFAPDNAQVNDYLFQIRLWVSYRFQSLARTVRGVSRRHEAMVFLHQLHQLIARRMARAGVPAVSSSTSLASVSSSSSSSSSPSLEGTDHHHGWLRDKLQILVAYQTYGDLKPEDPADLQKRTDLHYLLHQHLSLSISYLRRSHDGRTFNELMTQSTDGRSIETRYSIPLPGYPILAEGKPENQHQALAFVTGLYIQALDMNQDAYFEEEIKWPLLLREFERDPATKIVGFPELVTTRDYNLLGYLHAFSERTFTTAVQRTMDLLGLRMHYGHPDVFDGRWVETEGGFSRQSYVSEDIYAGYEVCLRGFRSRHVEYFQEGKAKEVGLLASTKFFTKVSAGAAQQMFTRHLHWMTSSPNVGFFRAFNHFFVSIGFFVEHQLLKYLLLLYLFSRMVFPNEEVAAMMYQDGPFSTANIIFGAWVLQMGFLLMFVGLAEMILERGVLRGVARYLVYFPITLIYYFFHVLTNASGYSDGMSNRARYIPTGRGFMLEHMSFRHLYSTFKASHLYFAFLCFCLLLFLAFTSYATLSVVWASVLGTVIWVLLPFLTNPGGTLFQCRLVLWCRLHWQDWRDWLAYSWRSSLFYRHQFWPIGLCTVVLLVVAIHFNHITWLLLLTAGVLIGIAVPWTFVLYLVVGIFCLTAVLLFNLLIALPTELVKLLLRPWLIHRCAWLYIDFFDKRTIGTADLSPSVLATSPTAEGGMTISCDTLPASESPSLIIHEDFDSGAVNPQLHSSPSQQHYFTSPNASVSPSHVHGQPSGVQGSLATGGTVAQAQVSKVFSVDGEHGRHYLVAATHTKGLASSFTYLGAIPSSSSSAAPASADPSLSTANGVPGLLVTPLLEEDVLDFPMPVEGTAEWGHASTRLVPAPSFVRHHHPQQQPHPSPRNHHPFRLGAIRSPHFSQSVPRLPRRDPMA